MARRGRVGYAEPAAIARPIGVVGGLHVGPVLLQVHDPRGAAASTGVPPHVDLDAGQFRTVDC